jgi:phosphoglycolate phosphatase
VAAFRGERGPGRDCRRYPIHRLVLWNIDQTLVDVTRVIRPAYAEAFKKVTGRPLIQLPQMVGVSETEIFFDALGRNGVSLREGEGAEELLEPFNAQYAVSLAARRDELTVNGAAMPGVTEALRLLASERSVVQSVLTGSSRPNALLKLRAFGLDKYLDLTIAGFAGSSPYPKGALLSATRLKAQEKYNASYPDKATVYIADAVRDIEAAKIAGAASVGVVGGRASVAELREAGADLVLRSLHKLPELIQFLTAPA